MVPSRSTGECVARPGLLLFLILSLSVIPENGACILLGAQVSAPEEPSSPWIVKGLFWGLLGDAHASWWGCHSSPSYSRTLECAGSESGGGESGPLRSSNTCVTVLVGY